jgi:hypothetical protein
MLEAEYFSWKALQCIWNSNILAGRLCNAPGSRIFWLEGCAMQLELEYFSWKAVKCS